MYHIWRTLCHRAVAFLGGGRWEMEVQRYTGRRKRLGSAFSSTKSELPLACTEQRLLKHSGNFSLVMLLKGYFFSFKPCVVLHNLSQALCYHLPWLPSVQCGGAAANPPNGNPTPRGSTSTGQRHRPSPLSSPVASAPGANAHPPSEMLTPPTISLHRE